MDMGCCGRGKQHQRICSSSSSERGERVGCQCGAEDGWRGALSTACLLPRNRDTRRLNRRRSGGTTRMQVVSGGADGIRADADRRRPHKGADARKRHFVLSPSPLQPAAFRSSIAFFAMAAPIALLLHPKRFPPENINIVAAAPDSFILCRANISYHLLTLDRI